MRRRTIWIRNAPEIPMWIFQEENANPKLRREEAAEDLWIEDNTDLQREITTADETGVLPNASLKSQLVMQEKELRIKKVHALFAT